MDDSFFDYLNQLELIGFFSGYPLIYAAVSLIAGNRQRENHLKKNLVSLLPYSYALVATLYLGFELNKLYPDYSIENIYNVTPHPFLLLWGVTAVIFWIPVLTKRVHFTLLHSLVFFILLLRDICFSEAAQSSMRDIIRNDMKIYTVSILLNSLSFLTIATIYFLAKWFRPIRKSSTISN